MTRASSHDADVRPISLMQETPLALADVPRYLPRRNGRKVHYSTIFRWVTKGARGRVLESTLVGGVRYTTVEAIDRFLQRQSAAAPASASEGELAEVERQLDAAGL
jgi:hypothetical protein